MVSVPFDLPFIIPEPQVCKWGKNTSVGVLVGDNDPVVGHARALAGTQLNEHQVMIPTEP